MKIDRIFVETGGILHDITELQRTDYERFLAMMETLKKVYEQEIKKYDEKISRTNPDGAITR